MPAKLDLTGQRFGRLTALRPEYRKHRGWACRCDCGATTWVLTAALINNNTKSCGCAKHKHGHGAEHPLTYRIWVEMRRRCRSLHRPAYGNYGGRGINVCPEWHDYAVFLKDMGEAPENATIERIDNNRGYAPNNCRWATRAEQNNNKRSNRRIQALGKTQTIAQWSRETGIHKDTLWRRLTKLGWSPERALTEPVKRLTT